MTAGRRAGGGKAGRDASHSGQALGSRGDQLATRARDRLIRLGGLCRADPETPWCFFHNSSVNTVWIADAAQPW